MSVYDNLVGMEEVLDEFIIESEEILEAVNEDLVHLESDPDGETVNRIFRAFHTFKGTCGFLGFEQAKDLAHVAEDLLNNIRSGDLVPTADMIDVLLEATDWFGVFINDVKERAENVYDHADMIARLKALLDGGPVKAAEKPAEAVKEAPAGEPVEIELAEPVEIELAEPVAQESAPADPAPATDKESEKAAAADVSVAEDSEIRTDPKAFENLEGLEEVLDEFIVETGELLEQVGEDLINLETETDPEVINRVFRAFHTFKGTCGFLGFNQAKEVAHVAEDVLNQIRNGSLKPNGIIIDLLLEAVDWFTVFVGDVKERKVVDYESKSLRSRLVIAQAGGDVPEVAQAAVAGPVENGKQVEPAGSSADAVVASKDSVLEMKDMLDHIANIFHTANDSMTVSNAADLARELEAFTDHCEDNDLIRVHAVVEKMSELIKSVQKSQSDLDPAGNAAFNEAITWLKSVVKQLQSGSYKDVENAALITTIAQAINGKAKTATAKPAAKPAAHPKDQKPPKAVQTIRVDMERLENLMNLAGELVLNRNQLGQAYFNLAAVNKSDTNVDNLDQVNNSLGRITTEIQEAVMQMRMLPISNVFRKYPRVVRDLAREQSKKVELVMEGEDTELDRSVIEAIGDPLLHLVRNSADHGIEQPADRIAAGKPELGTITLRAAHEGNHIVIEVEDDGAGMDAERLAASAVEKGVITASEAETMSLRDKLNLIFRPGFSTAKLVTDVSGRGVGMDVVHTNVAKLNGVIDIDTTVGKGTRIKIKLPLTLAIVTGLKVAVWDEEYVIPFASIIETVKLKDEDLTRIEDKWVIRFRDAVIHTLFLDEWFKVPARRERKKDEAFYAVVVAVAEFRHALIVTGMEGQEEAVIKPLGQVLGRIPGIAGGTIGGDGRITLILDIPELIQSMGLG